MTPTSESSLSAAGAFHLNGHTQTLFVPHLSLNGRPAGVEFSDARFLIRLISAQTIEQSVRITPPALHGPPFFLLIFSIPRRRFRLAPLPKPTLSLSLRSCLCLQQEQSDYRFLWQKRFSSHHLLFIRNKRTLAGKERRDALDRRPEISNTQLSPIFHSPSFALLYFLNTLSLLDWKRENTA